MFSKTAVPKTGRNRLQLQLPIENKRLARIWFAGINPHEFIRMTQTQEIERMSVPLLCDEIMRYMSEPLSQTKPAATFAEFCYIMWGLVLVYNKQVKFLFDNVMRQSLVSIEYARSSFTKSSSKKRRSRKNNDSIDHLPKKRVKFDENEFELESVMEIDDESTIQMLKTSKVMNRDQISIREVLSQPEPDIFAQFDGFDVSDNANTQKFLEIRESVSNGRSLVHIFQSERCTTVTGDSEQEDEQYYAPMAQRDYSPLPDIEGCRYESDENAPHDEDIEMRVFDAGNAGIASNVPDSPPFLPVERLQMNPAKTTKKRKPIVFDDVKQIQIVVDNLKTDEKQMRCSDARSDCVSHEDLVRILKSRLFNNPTHALKTLKPRYKQETDALMMGVKLVKRIKRKEPNDLSMVEDFLNPSQPQDNEFTHDKSVDRPLPCNDANLPNENADSESHFSDHYEPMYESDEEASIQEPVSILEPKRNFDAEAEHEPNLPSINQSPVMQVQRQSFTVPEKPVKRIDYRLASEHIPNNVLQLLNKFVTSAQDPSTMGGSQALFVLKNKQNRRNWGLIGVLTNLFRLWHNDVYPLGMRELMHPQKDKLAAALAFYSIMELNSPRIGLIFIEKCEDSNAVYNIAMSPKLIDLLKAN